MLLDSILHLRPQYSRHIDQTASPPGPWKGTLKGALKIGSELTDSFNEAYYTPRNTFTSELQARASWATNSDEDACSWVTCHEDLGDEEDDDDDRQVDVLSHYFGTSDFPPRSGRLSPVLEHPPLPTAQEAAYILSRFLEHHNIGFSRSPVTTSLHEASPSPQSIPVSGSSLFSVLATAREAVARRFQDNAYKRSRSSRSQEDTPKADSSQRDDDGQADTPQDILWPAPLSARSGKVTSPFESPFPVSPLNLRPRSRIPPKRNATVPLILPSAWDFSQADEGGSASPKREMNNGYAYKRSYSDPDAFCNSDFALPGGESLDSLISRWGNECDDATLIGGTRLSTTSTFLNHLSTDTIVPKPLVLHRNNSELIPRVSISPSSSPMPSPCPSPARTSVEGPEVANTRLTVPNMPARRLTFSKAPPSPVPAFRLPDPPSCATPARVEIQTLAQMADSPSTVRILALNPSEFYRTQTAYFRTICYSIPPEQIIPPNWQSAYDRAWRNYHGSILSTVFGHRDVELNLRQREAVLRVGMVLQEG